MKSTTTIPQPITKPGTSPDDIPAAVQHTGSCSAGPDSPGLENAELEWAKRHIRDIPAKRLADRKTELSGTGVPVRKKPRVPDAPAPRADPLMDLLPEVREGYGDLAFLLIDRMDRIAGRLDKKIDRLSGRVDGIESRGRFR